MPHVKNAPFGLVLTVWDVIGGDYHWDIRQYDVWVTSGEAYSRQLALTIGSDALIRCQCKAIEKVIRELESAK